MAFKTRVTELLEIEHPIVQGGLMVVGVAMTVVRGRRRELAAGPAAGTTKA